MSDSVRPVEVTVTEKFAGSGFRAEPEDHLWIHVEGGAREDRWRVAESARAAVQGQAEPDLPPGQVEPDPGTANGA